VKHEREACKPGESLQSANSRTSTPGENLHPIRRANVVDANRGDCCCCAEIDGAKGGNPGDFDPDSACESRRADTLKRHNDKHSQKTKEGGHNKKGIDACNRRRSIEDLRLREAAGGKCELDQAAHGKECERDVAEEDWGVHVA
jgi:hypothetical protein